MRFLVIIFLLITSCSKDILIQKKGQTDLLKQTELSDFANQYFWDNFHKGNYHKLDSITYYLTAAYNENPNHLETVTHLGFSYIWKLSERNRLEEIPPTIVDNATLSLKYFDESQKINSKDPRTLGFLADLKMTLGSISNDNKLTRQGYFEGLKSIRQWKTFNYFTIGYVLSGLDFDSWQFEKGVDWQWKTLNECYGEKIDKQNPEISKYLGLESTETDLHKKRACWNSWIAPHNVEGFYLNMGDMLVKKGDWEKAIEIYLLAKEVPQYDNWEFKEVLERRISNASVNVNKFREEFDRSEKKSIDDVILLNTSISCMSCHKMSDKDQKYYEDFDWEKYKEDFNIYNLN